MRWIGIFKITFPDQITAQRCGTNQIFVSRKLHGRVIFGGENGVIAVRAFDLDMSLKRRLTVKGNMKTSRASCIIDQYFFVTHVIRHPNVRRL